jgi:ribosomal protein L28
MGAVLEEGGSGTRKISGKHRFLTEKHQQRKRVPNVAKATSWRDRNISRVARGTGLLTSCCDFVTLFCDPGIDDIVRAVAIGGRVSRSARSRRRRRFWPAISRDRLVSLQACPASPADL